MTSVFVYEHLTALGAGESQLSPSLVREGRAMFDAVAADFRSAGVEVIALAAESDAAFRTAAASADFSLIIAPECEGILETRCRWVEAEKGRLLGPSADAVRRTADKLDLSSCFDAAGVPTPRTWRLGSEPASLWPRVWKPRFGAGSQDTFLLTNQSELESAGAELARAPIHPEMVAQEFAAGVAASVAFLIGPKERVPLMPCLQRLSADGRFRYLGGSLPLPAELAERAVAVGVKALDAVPGLSGYVGVDVVICSDVENDRVIEINPRLTTSYVGLRRLARFNIAELLLCVARGDRLPPLEWERRQVEFAPDGATALAAIVEHTETSEDF